MPMDMRTIFRFVTRLSTIGFVAGLYYVTARLGLLLAFEHTNASVVWPASGVAFALVLTKGFRVWPGVLIGAFLANYHTFLMLPQLGRGSVFLISLLIGIGNTFEAVLSVYLAKQKNQDGFLFGSLQDVFRFLGAVAFGCLASAAVGPVAVCAFRIADWSLFSMVWSTWYLGDVTGILAIAPILLTILRSVPFSKKLTLRDCAELILLFSSIGLIAWASFGGFYASRTIGYILFFLIAPPMVWLILRFGMREAVMASILLLVITVWQTAHGHGPFAQETVQESLLLLQAFVSVGAATFLVMVAMVQERKRVQRELEQAKDHLELRVGERTAELAKSNFELRTEIENRTKIEKELEKSKGDLQEFLDNMSTMSAKIGLNGEIILVNKVAQVFSGVPYEELLKINFLEGPWWSFDLNVQKRVSQAFRQAAAGTMINYDEKLRGGQGQIVTIDFSLMPVKDRAGTVQYILAEGRDITPQKQAEEEVRKVNRQRGLILNSAVEGIYGVDQDGNATLVNPAALKMLGFDERELVGHNIHFLTHHSRSDGSRFDWQECLIYRTLQDGIPRESNIEVMWRKDGTYFPVEYRATPLVDEGKIVGAFVAFQDITFQKLKEELDMKSKFISTVSHELRTPLTAIKDSIGIVVDGSVGKINEEQKDFLDTAKRNVDRLARLINNVLNFQRLDLEHVAYEKKKYDLNAVVLEVKKTMERVAKNKKLDLDIQLEEKLPEILIDKDYILQVLVNLVDNAIKFTDKGYVRIKTDRADHAIEVSVEDTGVGIRQEDIEKLFQSFSQIQQTGKNKRSSGSGLGLAISQKIIEQHGGKLCAESEFGKGSRFYFVLPIEERRGKLGDGEWRSHVTTSSVDDENRRGI